MKDELQMKLAEEFPFMQRKQSLQEQKANSRISDLYGTFGCETGDGWYDLLRDMCREITEAYQKGGEPINLVVDQVKEKFGTLRFYYHFEGHAQTLHAFDFLGGSSMRFQQQENNLQKEIANIVRNAEKQSGTICEKCGKPGSLRKGQRILTLCDSCFSLSEEKHKPTKNPSEN